MRLWLCALLPLLSAGWQCSTLPALRSAKRTTSIANVAVGAAAELKAELLELLEEAPNRGIEAPAEVAQDILEVVYEMDDALMADDWANSQLLGGKWKLLYTSSRTFANNQGLSGYARDIAGVSTPEMYMLLDSQFKRVTYEEPVVLEKNSIAGLFGKFAGADSIKVECAWQPTRDGTMTVQSQRVVVGDNSWAPADRQDKAVRTLGAGRPVFLDENLLVMRSMPEYVCWCFARQ